MSEKQFHQFMKDQINEINKFKWLESEKAKHDLGLKCVHKWIKKHGKKYRRNWLKKHGG
jgi:hypothetical protein